MHRFRIALVVAAVIDLALAGAVPAHAGRRTTATPTPAPVTLDAAQIELQAGRTAAPTATRCADSPGIIQIKVDLAGQAVSADPRLSGTLTMQTSVLFSVRKGIGRSTGDVVIKDPASGRVKVRATLLQLETEGAAKFDGVLVGVVIDQDDRVSQLTALYAGRVDVDPGTLVGNVGADTPVAPHDSGLLVTGTCRPVS
ncbi:hypothetical protein FXF50_08175 [Micromonospora sp. AP08]|uniref:hypothetical protein n=1 Tax=Micromonospora sp. AP08 TaxID=2604467 RepID=UPI0011D47572|nr:hypothetical protein [Micromonospora sp. AP08]TYB39214.1 hypothetical protein FXF50_08175 [Micromonospora sp. AP08]